MTKAEELCLADAFHVLASLPGYRGAVIIVNTTANGDERAIVQSSLPGHMAQKLIQKIAEASAKPSSGPGRIFLPQ